MSRPLLITLDYPPDVGGVATYLERITAHFPADTIRVMAPARTDAHTASNVIRVRLQSRWLRPRWLPMLWQAWRYCQQERPSVIIVSHVLPAGVVAWLMKALFGIPYVVICHGMDIGLALEGGPVKRWQARKAVRGAAAVVVNSAFTAGLAKRLGASAASLLTIHPGANAPIPVSPGMQADVRERYGLEGAFTILTVCRLVKRKGVDDVIAALELLRRRGESESLRYVIVGSGPERAELEALALRKGVADLIIFVGGVVDSDLAALYATSDAFVLTPRALGPDVEGFGIVYLDANRYGKPVIASRSGGIADAVLDGQTGILVEEGNVAAIADAIAMLHRDRPLRERLGNQGKERVVSDFSWTEASLLLQKTLDRITHDHAG